MYIHISQATADAISQGADYSLADLVGGAPLTPDAIVRFAIFRDQPLTGTTVNSRHEHFLLSAMST